MINRGDGDSARPSSVSTAEDVDLQVLAYFQRAGYEGDRLVGLLGADGITSSFFLASARRLRDLGLLESDPSAQDRTTTWRISERGERVASRLGKYIQTACILEDETGEQEP